MKFAIYIVIALIAGAFAAQFLMADPGYVVINFRGWIVEMSVPGLVLLLGAVLFIAWLVVKIWRSPQVMGESYAKYRGKRAGNFSFADTGRPFQKQRTLEAQGKVQGHRQIVFGNIALTGQICFQAINGHVVPSAPQAGSFNVKEGRALSPRRAPV